MARTSGGSGAECGRGSRVEGSENLPGHRCPAPVAFPLQTGMQTGMQIRVVRITLGGGVGTAGVAVSLATENGTNSPSARTCICGLCAAIEKLRRAGTWLLFS